MKLLVIFIISCFSFSSYAVSGFSEINQINDQFAINVQLNNLSEEMSIFNINFNGEEVYAYKYLSYSDFEISTDTDSVYLKLIPEGSSIYRPDVDLAVRERLGSAKALYYIADQAFGEQIQVAEGKVQKCKVYRSSGRVSRQVSAYCVGRFFTTQKNIFENIVGKRVSMLFKNQINTAPCSLGTMFLHPTACSYEPMGAILKIE